MGNLVQVLCRLMSFINALKWSFFAEFATKLFQPLLFIVLTWFLTPEDFGVMTAAMMVVAFSQIFWEAGMGKALIRQQTELTVAANSAFWINLGLGVVVAILLYGFSGEIARYFFQDNRVTSVLQVMTVQILLGALCSVQTALLQKEMGFKKLFWVRFATVVLPGMASVPLAWYGWGYWALVMGTLVGQLVQVVMLWSISAWRPTLSFKWNVTRDMVRFGSWVGLAGFLAWFYQWADALIVGAFLGGHELGLYRVGSLLVIYGYAIVSAPVLPVFYSWLVREAKRDISLSLQKIVNVLAGIFIPLGFLIYGVSSWVETLFFEDAWAGVGQVIGIIALAQGLSCLFVANSEAYRAAGSPQYEVYPMAIGVAVFLPAYIFSIGYGMEAFLYARLLCVVAFGSLIHAVLANKCLGIKSWFFIRYIAIFSVSLMCLVFAEHFSGSAWGVAAISMVIGFALFVFIFIMNRDAYNELLSWIHKASLRES